MLSGHVAWRLEGSRVVLVRFAPARISITVWEKKALVT